MLVEEGVLEVAPFLAVGAELVPRTSTCTSVPSGVLDDHDGSRVGERRDVPGHEAAHRVVAAVGAAEPHDQGRRGRHGADVGHRRSTVRSRKWVAQEMHGS